MSAGALTDVPGIRVGHWTDAEGGTGCTVVLCDPSAVAAVDVRGAAPATRETDLLRPGNLVEQVHAVLLTGGSAFGLDAAGGVMRYLEERGVGFPTPAGPVPIVPGAALFDLPLGRADRRPDAAAGYAACQAATAWVEEGSVGAGTGATVAKQGGVNTAVKGGLGTASLTLEGGVVVAALAAVNAVGSIVDPASGSLVAGPRGSAEAPPRVFAGASTTLVVVATSAPLDRPGAYRLAVAAHDGLALAIRPAHTAYDGDAVFALVLPAPGAPAIHPIALGAAATNVVVEAILRGVRQARGLHGIPSVADLAKGEAG